MDILREGFELADRLDFETGVEVEGEGVVLPGDDGGGEEGPAEDFGDLRGRGVIEDVDGVAGLDGFAVVHDADLVA